MNEDKSNRSLLADRIARPRFLYGTAWKEEATRSLAVLAIQQGFRGIDTANQRRHYHEAAVGEAITTAIEAGMVTRADLFLQTKFTFRPGQDHRLPYDPAAPIARQVAQSFASSLEHLCVDRIDSYLLHGPMYSDGLSSMDWEAWRSIEAIHDSGQVRLIGVSNFSVEQLQLLFEKARVKPTFVQNRCYAVRGWDRAVRNFCNANEIVYQGFSLLTANRGILACPELALIAKRLGRTIPQIIFRFAIDIGMLPLIGTTNAGHMRQDLDVFDFQLDQDDITKIQLLVAT